jgi:hypothetical protein
MRSIFSAALLSVSLLAACDVGVAGNPGGNGSPDAGNGSGSPDGAVVNTPKVTINVDKPTLTTDLAADNTITVSVIGSGGFAGPVTLAAEAVDAGGAPLVGWMATLSTPTVTLGANGTGTATITLNVPGDAAGLAGSIKVTATSSAASQTAATVVTANPQVTLKFTNTGGTCNYDIYKINNPLKLKVGRKLRVLDGGTLPMQIHFDGGISGINHQGGTMPAGQSYDQTPTSAGGDVTFYCHDSGAGNAVDGGNGQLHQRLQTVP